MIDAVKALVGPLAVVATLALALVGCGGGTTSAPSTSTVAVPATTTPQPATPNYKIVAKTTSQRFDHKANYYIVIDPVDLSNDSFKQNVKLVLRAVAKTNGDPNFSADVFDDENTAKTAYQYDTNGSDATASDLRAHHAQAEQHEVAMYDGGIADAKSSAADDAYSIGWYPSAFTSTPNVGRYVSFEQWKP